jgi:formate dehydrogenase accessory protein
MVRAVYMMQEEVFARIAEADVPPLMQESAREYLAVLKKLRKAAKEEFITAALMQDKAALAALAEQHSLNEGFVRSTIWRIVAALVPAALKEPAAWDPDPDAPQFRENFCPVCGRRPVLAELRKYREGRTRDLICGGCGTRWLYARVGCAYCGNEDLGKMHTLEPKDSDLMRLDICDACSSYIKTYRGPAGGSDADAIYRQDWASVHLDLLAEQQGFQKKGNTILE